MTDQIASGDAYATSVDALVPEARDGSSGRAFERMRIEPAE